MNLYSAQRTIIEQQVTDPLYGQESSWYLIGTLKKPPMLYGAEDYLLYVLGMRVNQQWRGDQIALSAHATVEVIQQTLGRFWRRWNVHIDQYERFYNRQAMSLEALVAFNKMQHTRPRSEKQIRDYWCNRRGGLAFGG